MKIHALLGLTLAASLCACASEEETPNEGGQAAPTEQTDGNGSSGNNASGGSSSGDNASGGSTSGDNGFVPDLERGEPVDERTPFVALADLVADPGAFVGAGFVTEGTISQSCNKAGCWMELRPMDNRSGGRIITRFKGYSFFVPLDSRGDDARIEAIVKDLGGSFELEASGVQIRFAQ